MEQSNSCIGNPAFSSAEAGPDTVAGMCGAYTAGEDLTRSHETHSGVKGSARE